MVMVVAVLVDLGKLFGNSFRVANFVSLPSFVQSALLYPQLI
jgi:hypothetical protein